MKCPFKLLHAPYDGGSECVPECAWCLSVLDAFGEATGYGTCALAQLAVSSSVAVPVVEKKATKES